MVQAAEMRQPIKHHTALHGSALRGILVVNTRAFTPKTGINFWSCTKSLSWQGTCLTTTTA
jgi:hypothetical protein